MKVKFSSKTHNFRGLRNNAVFYISQMRLMVPSLKLHHNYTTSAAAA